MRERERTTSKLNTYQQCLYCSSCFASKVVSKGNSCMPSSKDRKDVRGGTGHAMCSSVGAWMRKMCSMHSSAWVTEVCKSACCVNMHGDDNVPHLAIGYTLVRSVLCVAREVDNRQRKNVSRSINIKEENSQGQELTQCFSPQERECLQEYIGG